MSYVPGRGLLGGTLKMPSAFMVQSMMRYTQRGWQHMHCVIEGPILLERLDGDVSCDR